MKKMELIAKIKIIKKINYGSLHDMSFKLKLNLHGSNKLHMY